MHTFHRPTARTIRAYQSLLPEEPRLCSDDEDDETELPLLLGGGVQLQLEEDERLSLEKDDEPTPECPDGLSDDSSPSEESLPFELADSMGSI